VVALFPLEGSIVASAYGRQEENYMWKLNQVIAARYTQVPWLPPWLLARRPGPERAGWMRYCFGPFTAGGASFRIHRGGGFWCSFSREELQLVQAPVALSEVVTRQSVRPRGVISLSVDDSPDAQEKLVLDRGSDRSWVARVAPVLRARHELAVSVELGHVSLGSADVSARVLSDGRLALRLELAPTDGRLGPPVSTGIATATLALPSAAAPFALVATSGTSFGLSSLRLAH
jgi:hypothetical protein